MAAVPDANSEIINQLYRASNLEELSEAYSLWAKTYEEDVETGMGYTAPVVVTRVLAEYLRGSDHKILDAGCGTGLVGRALKELGFLDIVGIDMNEEMLGLAQQKGVYRALHRMTLGEPLDLESDTFDAVLCVGTFTYGHAPGSCLPEFVRVVKPGGYVLFTQRQDFYLDDGNGVRSHQTALEQAGKWSLVSERENLPYLPTAEPGLGYNIWVYQRT